MDFDGDGPRTAKTKRLDLRSPGQIGTLRFNRIRDVASEELLVEIRANLGRDKFEGWTSWQPATLNHSGWLVPELRGEFSEVRITLPNTVSAAHPIGCR